MKLTTRQFTIAGFIAATLLLAVISRCGPATSGVAVGDQTPTINTSAVGSPSAPAAPPIASPTPNRPAVPSARSTADSHGEDGTDDELGVVEPTNRPDAREAAAAFTAAWLNTYGRTAPVWLASIKPRVTADLAAELAYADPTTIPAGGKVGAVTVNTDSSLLTADVIVLAAAGPAETLGTLNLTLQPARGAWLVSDIDWEPTR